LNPPPLPRLDVIIAIMALSSTRYADAIASIPCIVWNPDMPLSGTSIDMLIPSTRGAKNTAVPSIMSRIDFILRSSSLRILSEFWYCRPTARASPPASSISFSEQR